ncbi:MAG: hypothetical protein BMS9Abin31_1258 [Gammaproteobacteria bacterium]|nr:MAG: hypothetical protein BMS9Abin31_1258 [Gammaproteobacteria bacterium]
MNKFKIVTFLLVGAFMSSSFAANDSNELEDLLQKMIDKKELEGYWHVKTFPERVPLKIVLPKNYLNKNLKLTKFGQDVVFIKNSTSQEYFIIKQINENKNDVQIVFSYPLEGIKGDIRYNKGSKSWIEKSFTIIEK